ncbi:DsbA family oxidoreductase [Schaalia sp. lx-100]|uniref:DsbA family oxidoreductase n=1 Tax=Schaalia sp. lx-100 TaxID=2899081 RepID=UPI001E56D11A|nr:DsbA family protein [Schaalia sp. lx-100]MCD4558154.1 DsbA family protein [Schaalia sp. lx-100]
MQIEMWGDFTCPWSYLTLRHLRRVLADFPHRDEVEVTMRPFFLDPAQEEVTDMPWVQSLIENEDMQPAEALALRDRIMALGRAEGIRFDLDSMILAPGTAAFRVLVQSHIAAWEAGENTGPDTLVLKFADAIFRTRFEMGSNIADPEVIIGCAQDIGISPQDAVFALSDPATADDVWSQYQLAMHMGIDSVPTLLFDNTFVLQGMQTTTALRHACDTAWKHARSRKEQ